jgi:polar amino acid transport system permease protein
MNVIPNLLNQYHEALLSGFFVTLKLCLIAWVGGLMIGSILGYFTHSYQSSVGKFLTCVGFLVSSTPFLIILFWFYYPFQEIFGLVVDSFWTSSLVLVLIPTIGVAQIVRNSLDTFPSQYLLVAKVCGLSRRDTLIQIQLPILLQNIIPQLLQLQVNILHLTLFASLISTQELFRIGQQINSLTNRPVEIYTMLGLFYILISLPINFFAFWLQQKYTRNFSEN